MPNPFTDDDFDKTVRTVWGEAANQGPEGWKAVASVIRNRANSSNMSPSQVVLAPNQFEPWSARRGALERLDPNSPQYQQIAQTIRPLFYGEADDPTKGATHFYAPKAQAALGRRPPSWDNGTGFDIGDHRFFRLGYGGSPAGNPSASPSPTLASTLGRPMPTDPVTGQWIPENVIQNQFAQSRAPISGGRYSGIEGLLAGLQGGFGNMGSMNNQQMGQQAFQSAASAPDAEGMARALIGSNVPGAQQQGLALLLQERDPNKILERQMKQLQIDELKRNIAESETLFGGGAPKPAPASAPAPSNGMMPPTTIAAPGIAVGPASQPQASPGLAPPPTASPATPQTAADLSEKIKKLPMEQQLSLRKAYREKSPKFYELLDEYMDPDKKARQAGDAAKAKEIGEAEGKFKVALPEVARSARLMVRTIDALTNDKALSNVTGVRMGHPWMPTIRQSSADVEPLIEQIKGGAFMQAFQALKGAGAITEQEGAKATASLTRLQNTRMSTPKYKEALAEFRSDILELVQIAKNRADGKAPNLSAEPSGAKKTPDKMTDDEIKKALGI